MRVLQVHNGYDQRGGEDVAVDLEAGLLAKAGHEVERFSVTNLGLPSQGLVRKASIAVNSVWSPGSARRLADRVREFQPDVVHVHNVFPQFSASVYGAVKGTFPKPPALVQTMHNYRSVCANALLFRDGHPCMDCVGRMPWPGVVHACSRDSRSRSGVIGVSIAVERLAHPMARHVDRFIVLTSFQRDLLVKAGLPSEKLVVRPHSVADGVQPGRPDHASLPPRLLFVGRLSPEKGADLLLDAWELADRPGEVRIVGQGPEELPLRARAPAGVTFAGRLDPTSLSGEYAQARFVVTPSRWFETFCLIVPEAFVHGTPVIAPNHGGFPEMVEDGVNGFLFEPGSAASLAKVLRRAMALDPEDLARMRRNARATYEGGFTEAHGAASLEAVYQSAIDAANGGQ